MIALCRFQGAKSVYFSSGNFVSQVWLMALQGAAVHNTLATSCAPVSPVTLRDPASGSHLNATNCLLTSYLPGIWIVIERRVFECVNLFIFSAHQPDACAEMDLSIVEAGHQSNILLGPKWSHQPHRPT